MISGRGPSAAVLEMVTYRALKLLVRDSVLLLAVMCTIAQAYVTGQPPRFTQEPVDTYVFELDENGQPATLTLHCCTAGDPPPTVAWFRNGVGVNNGLVLEDGSLSIPNITEGESASRNGTPYYCTATNSLGTIRSKNVSVSYAFFSGINTPSSHEVINVTTGQDTALLCDVSGASPPPVIEWLDDNGVVDTERYLNGGQYLLLRELTAEQITNTYRCRVINAFIHDTVESSGTYTLNNLGADFPDNTLIVYKELETEVVALVGEDVQFSFVAAASSTLATQYQLDGSTEGVETFGPLGRVRNVQLPADGNDLSYVITLIFAFGTKSDMRTSTLTIYEPAAILGISSDDLDQFVGDPISLSCTVAGAPAPDVVWYFNGGLFTASDGLIIDSGTIDIPSPTTAHSGMYQCFVSNPASLVSASIALQIREPVAPVIAELSSGMDRCRDNPTYAVPDGENLTLSVTVTADPCPEVKWRVNGTEITEVEDINRPNLYAINNCSDFTDSNYTFTIAISNITDSTAGSYTATFSNRAGSITLGPIFVTPEKAAQAQGVGIQDSGCLRQGMNETIFCMVEGYPYPRIVFERNNVELMMDNRVAFNDCGTVVITSITQSDEGFYQCIADNVANGMPSSDSSNSVLLRYCTHPRIINLMSPSNPFPEGQSAIFTCTVSGVPSPDITWLKDGTVLSTVTNDRVFINLLSSDESQLVIQGVTIEDAGNYTCNASSIGGVVVMTWMLSVEDSGTSTILSTGAIIGIAVGCGILFLILCIMAVYYLTRKKSKPEAPSFQLLPLRPEPDSGGHDNGVVADSGDDDNASEEYRKLKKAIDNGLVRYLAAQTSALTLAGQLHSRKLISEDTYDKKVKIWGPNVSEIERMSPIIDAILQKVKDDRAHFHTFLGILEDLGGLRDVINEIET